MKSLHTVILLISVALCSGLALAQPPYDYGYQSQGPASTHRSNRRFERAMSAEGYLLIVRPGRGVDPESVQISIQNGTILVETKTSIQREETGDRGYYSFSSSSSRMRRRFPLPPDADVEKMRREVRDGEIIITLPFLKQPPSAE